MIIKNGTDKKIEQHKTKHNLKGDVYLINGHLLESLESHKKMFPNSTATSIEEAETEHLAFIEEQARLAKEQAEELARLESENSEESNEQTLGD